MMAPKGASSKTPGAMFIQIPQLHSPHLADLVGKARLPQAPTLK